MCILLQIAFILVFLSFTVYDLAVRLTATCRQAILHLLYFSIYIFLTSKVKEFKVNPLKI